MSAIFGIYYLDERTVQSRLLEEMSCILFHRGSDGTGIWNEGSVGLGHRMLWTTPESIHEHLPKKSIGGDFVITADARIDNREELLDQLGLCSGASGATISDSELILFAYKKWGEDCATRLLGDFVFAIWDKRNRTVFCARDHFGVKPFYYYASANCFAFSTEVKALFLIEDVPRGLNEDMIADYMIGNFENKATTFYKEVLRLPAASSIRVTRSGVHVHTYYSLDPTRELLSRSNEEYAEGLREVFTESVRCRIRTAVPLGSMLSGGLDSSSIACVTRDLLKERGNEVLPTFSLIYDRIKECDERWYINPVLSQRGFKPSFIPGDTQTPFSNLEAICRHMDRPPIGPGSSSSWGLYNAIREAGVGVLLDGHDGDSAVSHGYKYLDELASSGRWLSLAAEAKELAPIFSISRLKIIKAYVRQYRWRPFARKYPVFKKVERIGRHFLAHKATGMPEAGNFAQRSLLINKDFALRLGLNERYMASRHRSPDTAKTAREEHFRSITSGRQTLGLEELDSRSAAHGIETRYPFWDKRLIEYCLSLPGDQKCHRGWNRVVMRRAMSEVLPPEVCWRREKTDFTANFNDGLVYENQAPLWDLLFRDDSNITEYFDRGALQEMHQIFRSRDFNSNDIEQSRTLRMFWEVISLFSWLRHEPSLN